MSAAQDLFWLARYAFNTINPLVREDEKLLINLTFAPGDHTEGVDIWLHKRRGGAVTSFRTGVRTRQQVDALASVIKDKASQAEAQQQEITALLEPVSL